MTEDEFWDWHQDDPVGVARWAWNMHTAHRQLETPNWDTKTRCACGFESVSRCEWALHAIGEMQK